MTTQAAEMLRVLSKATLYSALAFVAARVFFVRNIDAQLVLAAIVWVLNASPESARLPAEYRQRFYTAGFLALVTIGVIATLVLGLTGASFATTTVVAGVSGFLSAAMAHWHVWFTAPRSREGLGSETPANT